MNKANDEMFENLIAIMKNDSRMKDLKTVDLLNINGQVEMFIVGVVYVYSLKGKVSDALVGDLKEATRKFIYNFIKGYVESKNNS
jgi:hypothetical protein